MREILFRGKWLANGEWMEGSLFIDDKGEKHEILVGYVNYRISWEVDPETVGQYTGLKDKNGKRIFEGDIVHCIARLDEADCVVIFEDGEFRLVLTERYVTYVTGGGFYALRSFEEEVVGNIHDNPELLGGDNA